MEAWKARCKDENPTNTVAKIKDILKKNNIEYKIEVELCSLGNFYSNRVIVINNGTNGLIATNGKGMSKEFCEASVFGELMERIENRMFLANPIQSGNKEDYYIDKYPKYDVYDEKNEIPCIKELKEKIAATVNDNFLFGSKLSFVNEMFGKLSDIGIDGKYSTLPFYSFAEKKVVYLPEGLLNFFVGSNGMAAGNTIEEAMVEGMSEIVERYSQMKFLDAKITPPLIPDEVIDKYPKIREIINKITADKKHAIYIYDCSLGIGLPVVGGIIVDKEKNKMGMKFGAHPNMAIALERVFTEAFQGISLDEFCNNNDLDFEYDHKGYIVDKWNVIKIGRGLIPATFFYDKKSYEFKPWKDVTNCSNKEMMFDFIDLFAKMGSDVYVRDASYLGFPAVHIYVPGVAEVKPMHIVTLKELNLVKNMAQIFNNLENVSDEDIETIKSVIIVKRRAYLENNIGVLTGRFWKEKSIGAPFDLDFLYAVCNFIQKKYKTAYDTLQAILAFDKYYDADLRRKVKAFSLFCNALNVGLNEADALSVIEKVCEKENVDWIKDNFLDRKKILSKLYKSCDNNCATCERETCSSRYLNEFVKKLVDCEKKNAVSVEDMIKEFSR